MDVLLNTQLFALCFLSRRFDGFFFSFHGQEMRAAILSRVAPIFSTRAAFIPQGCRKSEYLGSPKKPVSCSHFILIGT